MIKIKIIFPDCALELEKDDKFLESLKNIKKLGNCTRVISCSTCPFSIERLGGFHDCYLVDSGVVDNRGNDIPSHINIRFEEVVEDKKEIFRFKVGDIVEAFGLRGVVTSSNNPIGNALFVEFKSGEATWFRTDGTLKHWHKEPSLKLIERPKKKVKKERTVWINVYPDNKQIIHPSYEVANGLLIPGSYKERLACIETKLEWEEEI